MSQRWQKSHFSCDVCGQKLYTQNLYGYNFLCRTCQIYFQYHDIVLRPKKQDPLQ